MAVDIFYHQEVNDDKVTRIDYVHDGVRHYSRKAGSKRKSNLLP
jgi:hypothetical protein